MRTSELIELLCNDRLSNQSSRIRLSSFFAVSVLTVTSLYLFNAWHLSELDELIQQRYFQYLLCCLLLIYASGAKILVSLSRPGGTAGYSLSMLAIGLLLLWLPVLLTAAFQPLGLYVDALPLDYWLGHGVRMVLFALPWLVMLFMYLRFMAPTQLRLSGAMAGLVSGSLTSMFQLLNGQEQILSFYIYSASFTMVLLSLIAAALGPRLIRW